MHDEYLAEPLSWLPAVIDGIDAAIRQRGYATASIGGGTLFTLGLTLVGAPELVLVDVPAPAVCFLEDFAEMVLTGQERIDSPSWIWDDPVTGIHQLAVAPYTEGLGLAAALYGGDYRAVSIDMLSCPCTACRTYLKET